MFAAPLHVVMLACSRLRPTTNTVNTRMMPVVTVQKRLSRRRVIGYGMFMYLCVWIETFHCGWALT